jgi:hypothetical protein
MMDIRNFLVSFLCCVTLVDCVSSGKTSTAGVLYTSSLEVYGRFHTNDRQQVELISSAAHFGFSFEGNVCRLFVSVPAGQHNYLQYETDGVYQKRIRIDHPNDTVTIDTRRRGKHQIWIYKATEPHSGPVTIQKIEAENIRALKRAPAPVIEFIGNSITCGAAADSSDVPCGKGAYHDQHNAYMAYGPRIARALETGFILNSVSGIGMYRNWNSDGPVMPDVYEKLGFQEGGTLWDFGSVQPRLISIALGTNDFSNGDGRRPRLPFDSAAFTGRYIRFVQFIKTKRPNAQIVLLSSPMVQGIRNVTFQNCLQAIKNAIDRNDPGRKPVALFFFPPMQAGGCTGHPSVEDHAMLAAQLLPLMRSLLGD